MQLKGPTDALERGDLAQHFGYGFLWQSQQVKPITHRDISLMDLAPRINRPLRAELRLLGCAARRHERGVFQVAGLPLTTWLVETDVMAERGQPVLSFAQQRFSE